MTCSQETKALEQEEGIVAAQGGDGLIGCVFLCRGCLVFPGSYAWSNFTILALGVWAVAQPDSIDAIGMVSRDGGRREQGTSFIRVPRIHPRLLSSSVLKPCTDASQDGEPLAGLTIQCPTT